MGIIRDPAGKLISLEAVAIIGMQRSITSTITMRKRLLCFMFQSPFTAGPFSENDNARNTRCPHSIGCSTVVA
jgi:hypothetical protein